jgi:transposase
MGFSKGVMRDFTALEKRRIKAVRLVIEEGLSQGVAARRVRAAQQSVSGWLRRYRKEGHSGLAKAGRAGRKPRLSQEQLAQLETLLLEGPEAHGFPTALWTCPRVARLIRDRFGVRYHDGHVWKLLRALNWSPQRLADKARERKERGRGEAGAGRARFGGGIPTVLRHSPPVVLVQTESVRPAGGDSGRQARFSSIQSAR